VNHHETDQTVLAQASAKALLSLSPTTHELIGQGVGCSLTGWPTARRPNWTARRAPSRLEDGLTKKTVRLSVRPTEHGIVHLLLTIEIHLAHVTKRFLLHGSPSISPVVQRFTSPLSKKQIKIHASGKASFVF
jgi:hypothetical protein